MVFNADDLNLMLKSHEETLTAYRATLESRGKGDRSIEGRSGW